MPSPQRVFVSVAGRGPGRGRMRGAASHRQSGAPGKLRRDFPISRAHLRLPPAPSVAPQGGGRAAQAEPPGGRHPGAPVHRGICAHAWCSGTRKRSPFLLTVWERASGPPPPPHSPTPSPAVATNPFQAQRVGDGSSSSPLGGTRGRQVSRWFQGRSSFQACGPRVPQVSRAGPLMTIQHGWQLLPSPPLPPGLPAAPFTF